ncbi:MAG: ATP-binding cassette domain-containing protein [Rhodospirillales bacterium]|nr:ATP-binding cassette domain-containing protein [Rhodospirillales bacterium]
MAGLPLRIEGLTVSGEGGRTLLEVPELSIEPGTAVVVRGPSGAGKSTFLYAVSGILPVTAGRILWGDQVLSEMNDPARAAFRRNQVGFVFQDHLLFEELSAFGNASIAALYAPKNRRAGIRSTGTEQLEKLGLSADEHRISGTYSGGERQRIAVARALAADPAIVLADEPTASLDRENADRLADDLMQLARDNGRTLIAVTHDPAMHAQADRVIDIVDGRIQDSAA